MNGAHSYEIRFKIRTKTILERPHSLKNILVLKLPRFSPNRHSYIVLALRVQNLKWKEGISNFVYGFVVPSHQKVISMKVIL